VALSEVELSKEPVVHHLTSRHFPFSAIVGQEQLKTALILNAINPRIGGVLVRGAKGTAKSTAVRALAEVLPSIEVVAGCSYHCHPTDTAKMCDACVSAFESGTPLKTARIQVPFVTLPLSATEDRVAGTIDVAAALSAGEVTLKPGLMAEAHRGILYVDEVNLLDDHLANLLLDAAAMGRNIVEREGVSAVHPARFILIGTMNPEEGELRPQLLDRFGISVGITEITDLEARVAIMALLDEFDRNPVELLRRFEERQRELSDRVGAAVERLPRVRVEKEMLRQAALRTLAAKVEGHRADLALIRTATTLAAWYGDETVVERHLDEAAPLVLQHRQRRRPFERTEPRMSTSPPPIHTDTPPPDSPRERSGASQAPPPEYDRGVEMEAALPRPEAGGRRGGAGAAGGDTRRGKKLGTSPRVDDKAPLDVAATLLTAATHEGPARATPVPAVRKADLRSARIASKSRRLICFVVDASGSMSAKGRLDTARAVSRQLLTESYQGRHHVSLVTASGASAAMPVSMSRDAALVDRAINEIRPDGKTPLAAGLLSAGEELQRAERKGYAPTLVVLTDGRANLPIAPGGDPVADALGACDRIAELGVAGLVVDTENDFVNLGLGKELAERLGADYLSAEETAAETISSWIRERR
jgi:magnesium chelatase subunit D